MKDTTRLDAELSRWMADESPMRAPERLVHATRTRIADTPQRRVLRWPMSLRSPVSLGGIASLTVLGALVVMTLSLAIYLQRGGPAQTPSPAPSASPTSVPSAKPSLTALEQYECQASRGSCLGPLSAGVYRTTTFKHGFRFTVPTGWTSTYDVPAQFDLAYDGGGRSTHADGNTFSDRIATYLDPVAENAVTGDRVSTVGSTAAELATWLSSKEGVTATVPRPVSVAGATGFVLEIALDPATSDQADHCRVASQQTNCASLFVGADVGSAYELGLYGTESAVVYILDVESGGTVAVVVDDVDGVDATALNQAATPIVMSMDFGGAQ